MSISNYGRGDIAWWQEARFGMFIHWGLYSMPARHEWIRNYEKISNEEYQKYFEMFDPDLFQPREWAKAAKAAGMKYFVFTTKHHEGFCMWDSQYTDYKITNTPFGRDALRELTDAFRAEGLKVGFYYSLIDWHHPEFTVDDVHPLREVEAENEKNKQRDMKIYAQYMRDQVGELLTNYGKVDIIWFDFSYPSNPQRPRGKDHNDWESEKLVKLIRSLQPEIIIDDRLDLPGAGDFVSPEQFVPSNGMRDEKGELKVWEGCQTFSGAWGYHRDETSWKSPKMLIEMLIQHVSRGGNLLMNVGPTARGCFDERAVKSLQSYAEWMKYNSRSIYGCTLAPETMPEPENSRYTYNPKTNRLYLHLMSWPFKFFHLPELAGKVKYVQFLHDASEIKFRDASVAVHMNESAPPKAITLDIPVIKPNMEIPVIEIFLK